MLSILPVDTQLEQVCVVGGGGEGGGERERNGGIGEEKVKEKAGREAIGEVFDIMAITVVLHCVQYEIAQLYIAYYSLKLAPIITYNQITLCILG